MSAQAAPSKVWRAVVWGLRACLLLAMFLILQASTGPDVSASPLLVYDCGAQSDIPSTECEALVALHTSTNGAVWGPSWMTGSPCTWSGITCTSSHVTNIAMYSYGLDGPLPTELEDLTMLNQLSLNYNSLSGTIPSTLGNLSNLYTLDLSNNGLTGSIPSSLGSLGNVVTFYLHNNQLDGSIPTQLGNLGNVMWFNLSNNDLTGTIDPNLGSLSTCLWFNLSGNDIGGSIPTELGGLTSVQWLEMGGNQLEGSIPGTLGSLGNLIQLNLANNLLEGSIPAGLTALSNLQGLFLQGNSLSGGIPGDIGDLSSLKYLNLGFNQLTGPIPTSIGSLSQLEQLQLQTNQLDGGLPSSLGTLTNLTYLILSDNQFSGSIPSSLGSLTAVTSLYLSNNQLSGSIPSQLGNMSSLLFLYLQNNALEGEVPANLVNLTTLLGINLDFNMLVATDPSVDAFLKSFSPTWDQTQTIPPSGLMTGAVDDASVGLSWSGIIYSWHGGYYEVSYAESPGGPYSVHGTTADKTVTSYLVDGLQPATDYYFVVRTFTPSHDIQQNVLLSPPSAPVSTTTDAGNMALSMRLFRSPLSAPKTTPNIQWFGQIALGLSGAPGDDFRFMAWLQVPEDWQLPWSRQYSFSGDFSNANLAKDYASLSWVADAGNCFYGGPAQSGFKWAAWQGPQESLPDFTARTDNLVNLRGGYWIPTSEASDLYRGIRVVVGAYFDSDDDHVPDTYRCDGAGLVNIDVP